MCGGVEYLTIDPATGQSVARKTYFPIPGARIPVLDGSAPIPEVRSMQWGRRKGEDDGFDVPITGWARLLSLKEGKWNHYQPRRVKIPIRRWMEKDSARVSHWFELEEEEALLGIRIDRPEKSFVYVVTRPSVNTAFAHIHDRIPLIVRA